MLGTESKTVKAAKNRSHQIGTRERIHGVAQRVVIDENVIFAVVVLVQ